MLKKKLTNVEIMTRDGSKTYKNIIEGINSKIIQVSDRFHLLTNLTKSLELELKRRVPSIIILSEYDDNEADNIEFSDNKKESIYTENYERKLKEFREIKEDYENGLSVKNICIKYGCSTTKVYSYTRIDQLEKKTVPYRESAFSKYIDEIKLMHEQNKKAKEIHQELEKLGCNGSYDALRQFLNTKQKKVLLQRETIKRKTISWLMYNLGISDLKISVKKQELLKKYLKENPDIKKIIDLKTEFKIAIESQDINKLLKWLDKNKESKFERVKSFVKVIESDLDAVLNACLYPYSNGVVEGLNCLIKKEKRTMFGRCSFELLRKKLLLIHAN